MQGTRIIIALLVAFLIGGIVHATGGGSLIGVLVAVTVYKVFPFVTGSCLQDCKLKRE